MKIVVVGAGAVGGYFGGRWQEAGLDVTFYVRPGRAQQLKETGLVIQSALGNAHLTPHVATSVDAIGDCDLVLLAVKSYHLDGALDAVKALTSRGAYVLPLLNGMEHFDTLRAACGADRVLGGMTQIITTLDGEGRIVHSNKLHHISFGPFAERQRPFCERLVDASASANMSLRLSDHILQDVWSKYVFITAFSGVTTASRLPIDEVMAHPATARVYRTVLEEMSQLAAAAGTPLSADFVERTVASASQLPSGSTSSMHQDFRKGLPLEVHDLQGAAVRLAERYGVSVPTVAALYGLLAPYAAGPRSE